MKISLKSIMFITGVSMFILGIFVPRFIEKPKIIYKTSPYAQFIKMSGLLLKSPQTLHIFGFAGFTCAIGLSFYIDKLRKSLAFENDVLDFRRYLRVYHWLLFSVGVIGVMQFALTIVVLSAIQHVKYNHIFHYGLFGCLGYLFFCIWLFLCTRKYVEM